MTTIEQNKMVVTRFNREFLEGGNIEILKEIVSDKFVNHTAPANLAADVTGLIDFVRVLHNGFPDLSVQIHEQLGEGDLVATRKTFTGTHTGEIFGRAATGKKVIMTVIDIVRLENGKYVDHWGKNDLMQVIQSL